MRRAFAFVPAEDLLDRRWSVEERGPLPHRQLSLPPSVTGAVGVLDRVLDCVEHLPVPAADQFRPGGCHPGLRQCCVVAADRELRSCLGRELEQCAARILSDLSGRRQRSDPRNHQLRTHPSRCVVRCLRPAGGFRGNGSSSGVAREEGDSARSRRSDTAGSSSEHSASARSRRLRAAHTSRLASARLPAAASSAVARAASGSAAVVPGASRVCSGTPARGGSRRPHLAQALLHAPRARPRGARGAPRGRISEAPRRRRHGSRRDETGTPRRRREAGRDRDGSDPSGRAKPGRTELQLHVLGYERLESAVVEHAAGDGCALQHGSFG